MKAVRINDVKVGETYYCNMKCYYKGNNYEDTNYNTLYEVLEIIEEETPVYPSSDNGIIYDVAIYETNKYFKLKQVFSGSEFAYICGKDEYIEFFIPNADDINLAKRRYECNELRNKILNKELLYTIQDYDSIHRSLALVTDVRYAQTVDTIFITYIDVYTSEIKCSRSYEIEFDLEEEKKELSE